MSWVVKGVLLGLEGNRALQVQSANQVASVSSALCSPERYWSRNGVRIHLLGELLSIYFILFFTGQRHGHDMFFFHVLNVL